MVIAVYPNTAKTTTKEAPYFRVFQFKSDISFVVFVKFMEPVSLVSNPMAEMEEDKHTKIAKIIVNNLFIRTLVDLL